MKCPCKDCDRRKLLCHSQCAEYAKFKDWREEVIKRKAEGVEAKNYAIEKAIKIKWGHWK